MHDDDHDRGLAHDLEVMAGLKGRRAALQMLAGASLVPLFGCAGGADSDSGGSSSGSTSSGSSSSGSTSSSSSSTGGTTSSTSSSGSTTTCTKIPEETGGPFPGDGTNGPNALALSGIVRRDIRKSVGTGTATAGGVTLTVTMKIVNAGASCAALANYVVYLWHCDREGRYSMYSAGVTGENYLRGVQQADASGTVTFTTVFPAAYPGRWPHIHFEVYPTVEKALAASGKVATSQIALPQAACDAVFATTGYEASITSMKQTTLANDIVFSDGATEQLATMTGDVTSGLTATLTVPVTA